MLPEPAPDFIRHPTILHSMFVGETYLAPELGTVLERFDPPLLAEDPVGDPPRSVLDDGSITSSNLVHHAYHLSRYQQATGVDAGDLETVVEWGGGYGSLARLVWRLGGSPRTYLTVDTPLFACLQWLYLASVFGPDAVVLLSGTEPVVEQHRINVVPIGSVPSLDVEADLFISTWALNESTDAAQDHVTARDWFGARHLLLGMHVGTQFGERAVAAGARPVEIGRFMPGQHYYVR